MNTNIEDVKSNCYRELQMDMNMEDEKSTKRALFHLKEKSDHFISCLKITLSFVLISIASFIAFFFNVENPFNRVVILGVMSIQTLIFVYGALWSFHKYIETHCEIKRLEIELL